MIHRMVAIVVDECPWIFNFHSPSYVLRHSWYKNGKSHSISGNYVKYLRVEPRIRAGLLEGPRTGPTSGRPSTSWAFSSSRDAGDGHHLHKEKKVVVYYISPPDPARRAYRARGLPLHVPSFQRLRVAGGCREKAARKEPDTDPGKDMDHGPRHGQAHVLQLEGGQGRPGPPL